MAPVALTISSNHTIWDLSPFTVVLINALCFAGAAGVRRLTYQGSRDALGNTQAGVLGFAVGVVLVLAFLLSINDISVDLLGNPPPAP